VQPWTHVWHSFCRFVVKTVKTSTQLPLCLSLLVLAAAAGCGKKDDLEHRVRNYEVIEEGNASGVTTALGGGPAASPALTATNLDTTTDLTLLPDGTTAASVDGAPGSLAETLEIDPAAPARTGPPPGGASRPASPTAPPARREPEPSRPTTAEPRRERPAAETAPAPQPAPPVEPPAEESPAETPPPSTTTPTTTQPEEPPPPPPTTTSTQPDEQPSRG
jgi:hypothetical protein